MKELFAKSGIILSKERLAQFEQYRSLLLEYNEKFNLTNITDKDEVTVKHFIDSVLGGKYIENCSEIIDIGSGAGFPAIPLAIINNKARFTLLDSLNKRVNFLNVVIKELNLNNVVAIHRRAEEEGKKSREKYDCVIARAVASLPILLEYSIPLLKVGGILVAYKGDAEEEIKASGNALKVLGAEIETVDKYKLNGEYNRSFIIVKKVKKTPEKYPRGQNKPRISPL